MPNRPRWEPEFTVGHRAFDAQHREMLGYCDALADLCADAEPDVARFREVLDRMFLAAREHFAAEDAALVAATYPGIEDYRCEVEEYEHFAAEVITPTNFDLIEIQRFLALWWVGHIMGAAREHRPYLAA